MKITKEQIELLKRINELLYPENQEVQAVYKTPSQQLRDSADALDRRNELRKDFTNLIKELSWEPVEEIVVHKFNTWTVTWQFNWTVSNTTNI